MNGASLPRSTPPDAGYPGFWARAAWILVAVGVVGALFRAPASAVLVGVPLDTLVVALVYGLGCLILPELRPGGAHPVRVVLLRALLVVSAMVTIWVVAATSVALLLLVVVVVVASSPLVWRWASGHRSRDEHPPGSG